jgi:hypothetical protein
MAYDGKRFYFLDRETAMLSYRQSDEAKSHVALPNPLFLPLDFISDDDETANSARFGYRILQLKANVGACARKASL